MNRYNSLTARKAVKSFDKAFVYLNLTKKKRLPTFETTSFIKYCTLKSATIKHPARVPLFLSQ